MTFIQTDITTKMNKLPDYDSGCFFQANATYLEKIHNLNTRDLIVRVLYGVGTSSCANDGTSGTGRPVYGSMNEQWWILTNSSVNNVELKNISGAGAYFRILIWKGA